MTKDRAAARSSVTVSGSNVHCARAPGAERPCSQGAERLGAQSRARGHATRHRATGHETHDALLRESGADESSPLAQIADIGVRLESLGAGVLTRYTMRKAWACTPIPRPRCLAAIPAAIVQHQEEGPRCSRTIPPSRQSAPVRTASIPASPPKKASSANRATLVKPKHWNRPVLSGDSRARSNSSRSSSVSGARVTVSALSVVRTRAWRHTRRRVLGRPAAPEDESLGAAGRPESQLVAIVPRVTLAVELWPLRT